MIYLNSYDSALVFTVLLLAAVAVVVFAVVIVKYATKTPKPEPLRARVRVPARNLDHRTYSPRGRSLRPERGAETPHRHSLATEERTTCGGSHVGGYSSSDSGSASCSSSSSSSCSSSSSSD